MSQAKDNEQPVVDLVSTGSDELYTDWWRCPQCDEDYIATHFSFCPMCGLQVRPVCSPAAVDPELARLRKVVEIAAEFMPLSSTDKKRHERISAFWQLAADPLSPPTL